MSGSGWRQALVVCREIVDILVGERLGDDVHLLALALARAEQLELLHHVLGFLSGQVREVRSRADPVLAVAGGANGAFRLARRRIGGEARMSMGEEKGCGEKRRKSRLHVGSRWFAFGEERRGSGEAPPAPLRQPP